MTELFRYIQQAYALPETTGSIDTSSTNSSFQNELRQAISQNESPDQIRSLAGKFLDSQFPAGSTNPIGSSDQLLSFSRQLLALPDPSQTAVLQLVQSVFGTDASTLVKSDAFVKDEGLTDDALIAVKLITGFDRVNAADLATARQAEAFLEDLTAGKISSFTATDLSSALRRPIRIQSAFLNALQPVTPSATPPQSGQGSQPDPTQTRRAALIADQQALQSAYEAIMSLQPNEFQLKPSPYIAAAPIAAPAARVSKASDASAQRSEQTVSHAAMANPSGPITLTVSAAAADRLGPDVRQTLAKYSVDLLNAPVSSVVSSIKRQWQDVSRQLAPSQIPVPAPVFRVGIHLFAVQPTDATASDTPISTFFRKAITRPVGIGDLQVVRQELLGYVAGEVSHIENVLEGELLKRSTLREEINELTTSEETDSTQTEERDQQSTSRNELSTEAQKEASQQTSSVNDQTTTTDYGQLVENSKTNYAQSVTNRAVNTLTQMVKQQRVQREKKTFREDAVHELDNRQGTKKVRGIYQWVDKKYKARILNYGKRLLYDVVVPEPAAFLIDSLKNAAQPENFQLTKPIGPQILPTDLNPANYMYYASQYGVTGSVTPSPDEFIQTVAYQTAPDVSGTVNVFGATRDRVYYGAFQIQVPQDTKAISGYIQRTNVHYGGTTDRIFEFYIGENTFHRYALNDQLNFSFPMNGETGVIPVTVNTFPEVFQFNFAIGINCQRTDKAYEQWQLKTHATIVSGYQRQLADYQDKLAQYQAAVKSQVALAQNFAHDPSIEEEELKKAFIFLLLGEHFAQAFHPTPDPEVIPPDPVQVRDWGAMVAFFERAFEWENIMYTYYPYFWGRQSHWSELILIQDIDPQFEAFLKAGAARVVIPARPGFEGALAHYQETGDIWMGEEMPDMFSDYYVSIIDEIKARNLAPGNEVCVSEWDLTLPTTLIMLKEDETLPEWQPTIDCSGQPPDA